MMTHLCSLMRTSSAVPVETIHTDSIEATGLNTDEFEVKIPKTGFVVELRISQVPRALPKNRIQVTETHGKPIDFRISF